MLVENDLHPIKLTTPAPQNQTIDENEGKGKKQSKTKGGSSSTGK